MCGIVAIVGAGATRQRAERMARAMVHRGPDAEGVFVGAGVALAHRRLKVVDLTEAGAQPMTTSDGRYTLVYNGELYNVPELRARLPDVHFRGHSDTEVLLQLFARFGAGIVSDLAGMFAFAVWDAVAQSLFVARDRLGIKPLYMAEVDGTLLFASEIRPLLDAGADRTMHEGVLYDFLARDFYTHTDETFFRGVRALPAATTASVRDGVLETPRRYWHLIDGVERVDVPTTPAAREERLLELLSASVQSHLVADVPVGVALSGGLDSATLVALLARTDAAAQLSTYSFVFDDEAYSERPYVEALAGLLHGGADRTHMHFCTTTPASFTADVPGLVRAQEEPFAGLPIAAYASLHGAIRDNGTIVVMDGSGLDEALGGYTRFLPARWADLARAGDDVGLARAWELAGVRTEADRDHARAQMAAAASATSDVGLAQDLSRSVRPECLSDDFVRRAQRDAPVFERPFPDALRNLMYRELVATKLPRALRFRDRLSMMHSVELRPPFLDHRVLEYAFALPPEDHIEGATTKAILRRASARLLPDAVRLAAKRSVQTPQREWFRGPLAGWVRAQFDTPSFWARDVVDRARACAAQDAFSAGVGDNSFFLWQWVNVSLWADALVDGPAPARAP